MELYDVLECTEFEHIEILALDDFQGGPDEPDVVHRPSGSTGRGPAMQAWREARRQRALPGAC